MFHHLVTPGRLDRARPRRHGDFGGTLTKEDELTLDGIQWLARAFEVVNHPQSTLAVPLRELEARLELPRANVRDSHAWRNR